MAKLLFGSPDVRINVEKAWRMLKSPEVIHGNVSERKSFIAKVKGKLRIDDFLRGSNRKTTSGIHRYWNLPLWVIQPRRPKIMASPNDLPLEAPTFWNGEKCPNYLKKMFNEEFAEKVEKVESKADELTEKFDREVFEKLPEVLTNFSSLKFQTEDKGGLRDLNLKDILNSYSKKAKNKDEELQRKAVKMTNISDIKGPSRKKQKTPENEKNS